MFNEKNYFTIKKRLITQLQEGPITIEAYSTQHCSENNGQIEWAIQEPHMGDGGSPSVSNCEIDKADLDYEGLEGTFEINYVIAYDFGCDDMNNFQAYKTTCKFEIIRAKQELTLFFEEIPVRIPDSY